MMFILLDIDGVLVTEPIWKKVESATDGFMRFNPAASKNLSDILVTTGAGIILTSSHRINYSDAEWVAIFKRRGIEIASFAKVNEAASISDLKDRTQEIMDWVAKNNHIDNFVIVDDHAAILECPPIIKDRWVVTNPFKGIDDEVKQKILSVLSNQNR